MARFDYYGLETDIQTILKADADVSAHWAERDPSILIEREMLFGMDECPAVIIYMDSRSAPSNLQGISSGQRTRFDLRLSLWVCEFHLDSVETASKNRDDLIGLVEVALMKDRTLGGKVGASWLDGGEFMTAQSDNGFISCGEITLVAEGLSTTV